MMLETQQYCTFQVGEHWIGIPVEQVQEVLQRYELTPVPLAPDAVLGLLNLRGQIVMTIDLRRRLDLAETDSPSHGANIIVKASGELVGFVVDAMGDVQRVNRAQFEAPPETAKDSSRACITGCYKLKNHLLLELDVTRTVELV